MLKSTRNTFITVVSVSVIAIIGSTALHAETEVGPEKALGGPDTASRSLAPTRPGRAAFAIDEKGVKREAKQGAATCDSKLDKDCIDSKGRISGTLSPRVKL